MIASSSTFLRFGPTLSVCSAGRTQRVAAARAATGFSICHLLNRLTRLGRLIANVLVEGVDDDAPLRNAAHDGERSQFRSSLGRQSQADLRIVLDHLTGAKTRWWSTDFRSRWFLTHTIRFLIGDSSYQPIETGSTSVPAYCRDFWLGPRSCSAVLGWSRVEQDWCVLRLFRICATQILSLRGCVVKSTRCSSVTASRRR